MTREDLPWSLLSERQAVWVPLMIIFSLSSSGAIEYPHSNREIVGGHRRTCHTYLFHHQKVCLVITRLRTLILPEHLALLLYIEFWVKVLLLLHITSWCGMYLCLLYGCCCRYSSDMISDVIMGDGKVFWLFHLINYDFFIPSLLQHNTLLFYLSWWGWR